MTKEIPDMVIMGSSRAYHHYDPQIFMDKFKVSVYNAGIDGEGIPVAYGLLEGLKQRKNPQIIIIDMTPKFDLDEGKNPSLNNFYPYIYIAEIKQEIIDFDTSEKIKLMSNSYRINSVIPTISKSMVSSLNEDIEDYGYLPLYGKYKPDGTKANLPSEFNINSIKEIYFRKFIEEALQKDYKIIFAISPIYGGGNLEYYQKESDIIREYQLPILNHLNDTNFIKNPSYFQDISHMNKTGADEYSRVIANEISELLN